MRPTWHVSLEELDAEPHPLLARMRERSPVCWVPEVGGWLVTGYRAATEVLADAAAFTVDDPRFTTARVTGPSMLSADGAEHARHRAPFAHAFGPAVLQEHLARVIEAEAARLASSLRPRGNAELREEFAGPLAAAVMAAALGLAPSGVTAGTVLGWYRDIVAAVAALPAAGSGGAQPAQVPVPSFSDLAAALLTAMDGGHAPVLAEAAHSGALTRGEAVSNAAVALFGGIETAEGMICNAALHLLGNQAVSDLDRGVEESLRLEPAAAVVDRYATRDVTAGEALIGRGDLVRVSITGANRDPAVFPGPDRFDPERPNAGRHLAFARGPHFCVGAHLARLETVSALRALLSTLPGLRLDASRPAQVRGLVFRKPPALHAAWG
ncbi:MAG TPA: cytochrome P450 [Trebonia sp.]|nr:cytochrome P450 [Trebonia sp.]